MASEQLGSREVEPRVVILEEVENASVEVFDLPKPVAVGTEFECQGKVWRITANRPGTRVFLARSRPKTTLFRNLIVNLRVCLCGVPTYASAQTLDFLDIYENFSFSPRERCCSHTVFLDGNWHRC